MLIACNLGVFSRGEAANRSSVGASGSGVGNSILLMCPFKSLIKLI